jgi:hypothetical protein
MHDVAEEAKADVANGGALDDLRREIGELRKDIAALTAARRE